MVYVITSELSRGSFGAGRFHSQVTNCRKCLPGQQRLKQFVVFMMVMRSGDSRGHNQFSYTNDPVTPSVPVIISNLERVRNVSTLSKKKNPVLWLSSSLLC